MKPLAITAVVITRNEEAAIARCLRALDFCDQVVVVDSQSTDATRSIAASLGAEVIDFVWNGRYPKKKQWGMSHDHVRNDWVLHLDGDEVVSPQLANEIAGALRQADGVSAFDIPISYHFQGRRLRFGHRVVKRSLVNKTMAEFPEVDDLLAPGGNEVEGHYQPKVRGEVRRLRAALQHDDPDPLSSWIERHNRYSDWECYLALHPHVRAQVRQSRGRGGRVFDRIPLKPVVFFAYSYFGRLGILDGRAGLDYAFALSWYYWSIQAKVRNSRTATT